MTWKCRFLKNAPHVFYGRSLAKCSQQRYRGITTVKQVMGIISGNYFAGVFRATAGTGSAVRLSSNASYSAYNREGVIKELRKFDKNDTVPEELLYSVGYRRPMTSYRGVYWDGSRRKWRAYVIDSSGRTATRPFKQRMVGSYDAAIEAAKAHDEANLKFNGKSASVNFEREDGLGTVKQKIRQVSEYFGVKRDPSSSDEWMAEIKDQDEEVHDVVRKCSSQVEAAKAYDRVVRASGLLDKDFRTNFPTRAELEEWLQEEHTKRTQPETRMKDDFVKHNAQNRKDSSTPYIGVEKRGQRYRARVRLRGVTHEIGSFEKMEDAASARDVAWLELTGGNGKTRLNYPVTEYADLLPELVDKGTVDPQKAQELLEKPQSLPTGRAERSSRFRGVTWDPERRRWRARICHNRKIILIGNYKTEFEAVAARDFKALELGWPVHRLNIAPEQYNQPNVKAKVTHLIQGISETSKEESSKVYIEKQN